MQVKKLITVKILSILLLGATWLTAQAQGPALFTYSGGNGTPLALSLNADLQFTVASDVTAAYGIGFSILNAFGTPQTPGGNQLMVSSGLTLTDSRLGQLTLSCVQVGSPFLQGAPHNTAGLDNTTLYLFFQVNSPSLNLLAGDVITASAGSGVTSGNFFLPTPMLPDNSTLIVHDGNADLLGAIPVSSVVFASPGPVPEPSMLALSAVGGMGALLCFRRRK